MHASRGMFLSLLTVALAASPPARPKVPSWSELTASSALISWARPEPTAAEPAASVFQLQRKDGVRARWLTVYEGPAFAMRDGSLQGQLTYQYRVRAANAHGWSPFGDVVALHCRAQGAAAESAGDVRSGDGNADGVLDSAELRELIEHELSGGSPSNLDNQLRTALRNVDRNVDGLLTAEELDSFRERLGSMLTVGEVADWISHAVQLPQYAALFRENAISGYEFAALLEDGGSMLRDELGIESRLHRRQIARAIVMQLYGMGAPPSRPAAPRWLEPSEDGGTVVWEPPESVEPVHSYRLQRNDGIGAEWLSVYEGPALALREAGLAAHVTYQYRVQAWSLLGHSDYSDALAARCRTTGAGAQSLGDVRSGDANADGVLDSSELRELIVEELGGHSPEAVELQLRTALRNVDRNVDGLLTADELESYRAQLGSALSVDEVAEWVSHAVQLPQYAQTFRENAIVGHDFRGLLENGGELLRDELGIESRLHRRQISRAISMQLYGMGSAPDAPPRPSAQLKSSHEVLVMWRPADGDATPPVHKYRAQRRDGPRDGWHTVYDGPARSLIDVVDVGLGGSYAYRVQAWSLVGGSAWSASVTVSAWSLAELGSLALSLLSALAVGWQVPAVQRGARSFWQRVYHVYKDLPLPTSPRPLRGVGSAAYRLAAKNFARAEPLAAGAGAAHAATPAAAHGGGGSRAEAGATPTAPRAAAAAGGEADEAHGRGRSHWAVLQEQLRSADVLRRLKAVSASLTPSSSYTAAMNKLADADADRAAAPQVPPRQTAPSPSAPPPFDEHEPEWHLSDWAVHAVAAALKSLDRVRRITKDSSLDHMRDDDINNIDRCYLCHRTVGTIFHIRHICTQCKRIFCAKCGHTPHAFPSVICNDGCICRHHMHMMQSAQGARR